MNARWTLPAFAGVGIELEYAIVDRRSLAVRPIADALLSAFAGHPASAFERGPLGWSNELVRHVIELKNLAPTPSLEALLRGFQAEVRAANRALAPMDAQLMPTGMHPWMNPRAETQIWSADHAEIYRAYDRIFDCRRHGWANIQAMHINLPFADDAQFARLHAAVRLVLPLLPALAASSPIAEGKPTGFMDFRLEVYRQNARSLRTIAGSVIPETVEDRASYEAQILAPMYREIAPLDPEGVLRHEWLNARGAIARFDRNALEIRVADTQECPRADLAIATVTAMVVKALFDEEWATLWQQQAVATGTLHDAFIATTRDAEQAIIADPQLLDVLGIRARRLAVADVWQHLVESCAGIRAATSRADGAMAGTSAAWWLEPIAHILERGPLARRISHAAGGDCALWRLQEIYGELCRCLEEDALFG